MLANEIAVDESCVIGDVFRENTYRILKQHDLSVKDLILSIEQCAPGKVAARTLSGYLSHSASAKRNPTISTLQAMVQGFRQLGIFIDETDLIRRQDASVQSIDIEAFISSMRSAMLLGKDVNADISDILLAGLVGYLKSVSADLDDETMAKYIFSARQILANEESRV